MVTLLYSFFNAFNLLSIAFIVSCTKPVSPQFEIKAKETSKDNSYNENNEPLFLAVYIFVIGQRAPSSFPRILHVLSPYFRNKIQCVMSSGKIEEHEDDVYIKKDRIHPYDV